MAKVRFLGVATLLAASTVGALALLAPVTHGQQAAAGSDDRATERRVVRVVKGGGTEIGVTVRDVDAADAKREATPGVTGAVVEEVRSGSPGEKAGYKAGDIVTGFDGERVRSARQFARLVEETPAGRQVKSTVVRGGKQVDLEVVPEAGGEWSTEPRAFSFRVEPDGEELSREIERAQREARRGLEGLNRMPPSFKMMPDGPGAFDFEALVRPGRLGVGVLDMSPELAAYFGAKNGVVVNTVTPDSPAARAGVKVGDVITSVDGTTVDDSGDLRRRVWQNEDATTISLGLVRDRKELTVKVPVEAPKRETATRTRERV